MWRALLLLLLESLSMLMKFYTLKVHILKQTIIMRVLLRDVVYIMYDQRVKSFKASP